MAHLNDGSGVQAHSAGENFPYVVYLREFYIHGEVTDSRIMVSLAGYDLAGVSSWHEGHELAALFKRTDVRTVAEAQAVQRYDAWAQQDAEQFAVSRSEGEKRQRNDYDAMYGDEQHVPMTGPEMLAWKRAEVERFEEAERFDWVFRERETDAAFREREAEMAAAREAFYDDAEMNGIGLLVEHDSIEVQKARLADAWQKFYDAETADARDLARRALGIIE